jgi:hypothetical protein
MSGRFGVEVHAYVLMGNHYHLILRTPGANASRAMQWLNVSYSAWFNARLQRVGHVFQGRFRSTLVDGDGSWLLEVSAYVHLNPVRVTGLGLGKVDNKAEALGLVAPDRDKVQARLKVLREHRWSSYRIYGNYARAPAWLATGELLKRAGGVERYRRYVQSHVTRDIDSSAFTGFSDRIALGSREFLDRARAWVGIVSTEQPDRSFVTRRIPFESIVSVVESVKGESWTSFHQRYGDWGTGMVLYLCRMHSGLTLQQIGDTAAGMAYKAVYERVRRFKVELGNDPRMMQITQQCSDIISNMEM